MSYLVIGDELFVSRDFLFILDGCDDFFTRAMRSLMDVLDFLNVIGRRVEEALATWCLVALTTLLVFLEDAFLFTEKVALDFFAADSIFAFLRRIEFDICFMEEDDEASVLGEHCPCKFFVLSAFGDFFAA